MEKKNFICRLFGHKLKYVLSCDSSWHRIGHTCSRCGFNDIQERTCTNECHLWKAYCENCIDEVLAHLEAM